MFHVFDEDERLEGLYAGRKGRGLEELYVCGAGLLETMFSSPTVPGGVSGSPVEGEDDVAADGEGLRELVTKTAGGVFNSRSDATHSTKLFPRRGPRGRG